MNWVPNFCGDLHYLTGKDFWSKLKIVNLDMTFFGNHQLEQRNPQDLNF